MATVFKFLVPSMSKDEWDTKNEEMREHLSVVSTRLNKEHDPMEIAEVGNMISTSIQDFLRSKPDLFVELEKPSKKEPKGIFTKNLKP